MSQEKAGNNTLFYDTYALYAIAVGKESYKEFSKSYKIITTLMNLYELYYTLTKDNQSSLAEEFFNQLIDSCIDLKPENIKEAANFRFKEIKRKLSYVDCLGYVIAKANNADFLTGDIGFKELGNVKFIE